MMLLYMALKVRFRFESTAAFLYALPFSTMGSKFVCKPRFARVVESISDGTMFVGATVRVQVSKDVLSAQISDV